MNDQRTPFEREIDEVSSFNPASVLTYRPVEQVCDVCHEKHFGYTTTCARCSRTA
jgi:hypothetical protein